MSDKFPPAMQRPRLLALAPMLDISLTQLRRDECSDWVIIGRRGTIYALPAYFQIVITGWTARGWNACKADFTFASLHQNGEDEGSFTMHRDPTPDEAEKIRKWVGLKRRRHLDADALAALQARGRAALGELRHLRAWRKRVFIRAD